MIQNTLLIKFLTSMTIPLSKLEIDNIFLPLTDKITLESLKQYQNLDPVIRQ